MNILPRAFRFQDRHDTAENLVGMAELMTLELHFPSNWSFEGTVDVLYVDGASGSERSYGTLAQGSYMTRETYPGHRWRTHLLLL